MRQLLALLLLGLATPASAATVLELFTSQGCSSCPPADRLLAEAASRPGVIAISRPITYWDRLGWKDTLARPANTALQRAYAGRFGLSGVYTPQLVVDGSAQFVGSDRARLAAALAGAPDQASVRVSNGAVTVDGRPAGAAEVRLVTLRTVRVPIGRGENTGRTISYTNVVMGESRLGGWAGGAARFTFKPPAPPFAVLVQRVGAGPILGAALVSQ